MIVDTVHCVHFTGQGGNENKFSNTEASILLIVCFCTEFSFTWVKPLDGNFQKRIYISAFFSAQLLHQV